MYQFDKGSLIVACDYITAHLSEHPVYPIGLYSSGLSNTFSNISLIICLSSSYVLAGASIS